MKRQPTSIDGFIPRRQHGANQQQPPQLGGLNREFGHSGLTHASDERALKGAALEPSQQSGLRRSDIDASLASIDQAQPTGAETSKKKAHPSRRKLIKRLIIALIIILIAGAAYIGVKALLASNNVFQGGLLGLTQSQPLKQDANGRSNIVLFGTSEDDEGGDHPGAYLTDSIMVVSINQTKKDAYMFSIPRDLWVKYGAACNSGYEGKINEVFTCYSEDGKNEPAGSDALRKEVSEITGLDVQYYAHVNYSVVREAVDAVGGVEVNIESQDPRGILDRNFDWKCNRQCYYVKYANGPTGIMDGEHALALARARGSSMPTYGLERGNFDREINQQKILKALQEKAVSAGTLTNIGKVSGLLDAFGNNLRTNFETKEIRTLMNLSGEVKNDNIKSLKIIDAEPAILTTGQLSGISIVRPVAGIYDYSQIAAYINKNLNSDEATRENAQIGVYNGSGTAGAAQTAADKLTQKGFTVIDVGNVEEGEYGKYRLYILSDKTPATKARLEKLYGVTARTDAPPFDATGLDVAIIVGEAPGGSQ